MLSNIYLFTDLALERPDLLKNLYLTVLLFGAAGMLYCPFVNFYDQIVFKNFIISLKHWGRWPETMTGNIYLKANSTSRSSFVCKGWVSGCFYLVFTGGPRALVNAAGGLTWWQSQLSRKFLPVWTLASLDIRILGTCSVSLCSPACPPTSITSQVNLSFPAQAGCSPSHLKPIVYI